MYAVIEMQKTDKLSLLTFTYDNFEQAKSKYHSLLAVACMSSVPVHSVTLLDQYGRSLCFETYEHKSEDK